MPGKKERHPLSYKAAKLWEPLWLKLTQDQSSNWDVNLALNSCWGGGLARQAPRPPPGHLVALRGHPSKKPSGPVQHSTDSSSA
jgi:hypothetical protein